jgi:uncharacterized protein
MSVNSRPFPLPHKVAVQLIPALREQHQISWRGLHGAPHWARVMLNGMILCDHTPELRRDVVALFALFHDCARWNEDYDPDHGARGAEVAAAVRARYYQLDDEGFALLVEACRTHTGGRIPSHPTVMACWDSDRLDLPRVGATVRPAWLGTPSARDPSVLRAAELRSVNLEFPWAEVFLA